MAECCSEANPKPNAFFSWEIRFFNNKNIFQERSLDSTSQSNTQDPSLCAFILHADLHFPLWPSIKCPCTPSSSLYLSLRVLPSWAGSSLSKINSIHACSFCMTTWTCTDTGVASPSYIYIIRKVSTWLLSLSPDKLKFLYIISWWTQVLISGTSIVTPVVADGASTEFFDSLRIEMRMEDGECQWKSEREERKKETSAESETVRLAIINHIRCWRRPRILATRQTLRLSSIPISFFC